jgi:hypothetical protein
MYGVPEIEDAKIETACPADATIVAGKPSSRDWDQFGDGC